MIWDNIGLEQQDRNIPAYQLMADVMNRLDIHSGTLFNYHQQRQNSKNYLSDLELLQYDILYGKQYAYKGQSADYGRSYGNGCEGRYADEHRSVSGKRLQPVWRELYEVK